MDHVRGQVAVSLDFQTGIAVVPAADALTAPYPSPAVDEVNLPFALNAASAVRMEITDAQGRVKSARDLGKLGQGSYKEVLALAAWAPGTYTCTLRTDTTCRSTTFVVGAARQ